MDVKGGIALVTGGAQGIGRAICVALLNKGCKICCADINSEKGNETVKQLQEIYGEESCIFVKCDVSSKEEFEATYLKATETFGKVNILINNAGVTIEEKAIAINLNGTINGCNLAYEYMGKHNGGAGGQVVNVSSIVGVTSMSYIPMYSASKAGIIGLTRSLGHKLHYERSGIKFTTVCPYMVNTEMCRKGLEEAKMTDNTDKMGKRIQLLEPEDVAEAVIQLLEEGRNGSVMTVIAGKKNEYLSLPELETLS